MYTKTPKLSVRLLTSSAAEEPLESPGPEQQSHASSSNIVTPVSRLREQQEQRRTLVPERLSAVSASASASASAAEVSTTVLGVELASAAESRQRSIINDSITHVYETAAPPALLLSSAELSDTAGSRGGGTGAGTSGGGGGLLRSSMVTGRGAPLSQLKVSIAAPADAEDAVLHSGSGTPIASAGAKPGGPAREDLLTPNTTTATLPAADAGVAPRPPTKRSSAANAYGMKTAWRCNHCGYLMLAMNQHGVPIPLDADAYGDPLPLTCPRCGVRHTNWSAACPFDRYGNYANVRSRIANQRHSTSLQQEPGRSAYPYYTSAADADGAGVVTANTPPSRVVELYYRHHPPAELEALPAIEGTGPGVGTRAPRESLVNSEFIKALGRQHMSKAATLTVKRRTAYFCNFCGRRLYRFGVNGELVPLDKDKSGAVLPLTCPGCGRSHGRWDVLPFNTAAKPAPQEELDAFDADGAAKCITEQ